MPFYETDSFSLETQKWTLGFSIQREVKEGCAVKIEKGKVFTVQGVFGLSVYTYDVEGGGYVRHEDIPKPPVSKDESCVHNLKKQARNG